MSFASISIQHDQQSLCRACTAISSSCFPLDSKQSISMVTNLIGQHFCFCLYDFVCRVALLCISVCVPHSSSHLLIILLQASHSLLDVQRKRFLLVKKIVLQ